MKQVLVTGASSDIGLAVCRRYLSDGWRVVAHYRSHRPELDSLIAGAAGRVVPLALDFSDTAGLEGGLTRNWNLLRASDALVSCAATLDSLPFAEVTAEALLHHFAINVVPGVLLMRDLAPAMVQRGWGRIVHLSSIGVKFGGGSGSFCYALSKHAQEYLPSDHKAWAAAGVLVNVLRVGVTDTRFHKRDPSKDMNRRVSLIPAGRMASPDEIAETAHWLGGERNTFMTGQVVAAAGGE